MSIHDQSLNTRLSRPVYKLGQFLRFNLAFGRSGPKPSDQFCGGIEYGVLGTVGGIEYGVLGTFRIHVHVRIIRGAVAEGKFAPLPDQGWKSWFAPPRVPVSMSSR